MECIGFEMRSDGMAWDGMWGEMINDGVVRVWNTLRARVAGQVGKHKRNAVCPTQRPITARAELVYEYILWVCVSMSK